MIFLATQIASLPEFPAAKSSEPMQFRRRCFRNHLDFALCCFWFRFIAAGVDRRRDSVFSRFRPHELTNANPQKRAAITSTTCEASHA